MRILVLILYIQLLLLSIYVFDQVQVLYKIVLNIQFLSIPNK